MTKTPAQLDREISTLRSCYERARGEYRMRLSRDLDKLVAERTALQG